jgi:hypothetical protein
MNTLTGHTAKPNLLEQYFSFVTTDSPSGYNEWSKVDLCEFSAGLSFKGSYSHSFMR